MVLPIEPYLYTARTFEELSDKYVFALQSSGPVNYNVANQIKEYLGKESRQFLTFTEKTKMEISHLLKAISPVSYSVTGRKKGFASFCKKLEEISPTLIKDTYALRVISSTNLLGKEVATNFCYMAAKVILDHFFKMGWKAEPLTEKLDNKPISEEIRKVIYIPEEIPAFIGEYSVYLKDYISQPKANGYQGIHMLITDVKTGNRLEIQIRTSDMHEYAENGGASHKKVYKPKKFIYENIHMEGFVYDPSTDTIVSDKHGLIMPLLIGENCRVEKPNDPINWL